MKTNNPVHSNKNMVKITVFFYFILKFSLINSISHKYTISPDTLANIAKIMNICQFVELINRVYVAIRKNIATN